MKPFYQQEENITEAECLVLLNAWTRDDEQRQIALDNDLDKLVRGVGKGFGRLQAAMVLYRLIEKGYYP